MGPWASHIWRTDPRHLGFLLARYKFASKILAGSEKVLEIGCGDAFGMPVILQTVGSVHGIDFEPLVINDAIKRYSEMGVDRATFSVHDMLIARVSDTFDAAFSLDVIEHIPQSDELQFFENIVQSLTDHGVLIIGTPNITSKEYASSASNAGHINLKSAETLKFLLSRFFHNVFMFSMNDEVVHTGYSPMAHYLIGMGVGVRNPR
jgi:cyclopropane fatty-acyl-phospholipid synthase-like methyltransferase